MEGLPLKYIAIVLVAAIVIVAVYSVASTFTGQLGQGGGQLTNVVGGGINATAQDTCVKTGGEWFLSEITDNKHINFGKNVCVFSKTDCEQNKGTWDDLPVAPETRKCT